jgi:hypothetical protein
VIEKKSKFEVEYDLIDPVLGKGMHLKTFMELL